MPPAMAASSRAHAQNGGPGGMDYSNECVFLKGLGDDGNPAAGPDIADVDTGNRITSFATGNPTTALPTRDAARSDYPPTSHGLAGHRFPAYSPPEMETGSNDMSGTSPSGQSSRPTPNSSTASDQRQNLTPGGRVNGSGVSSFEASPVAAHQNIGAIPVTGQGGVENSVSSFFGDPSSFGIPPTLTSDQRFIPDTPRSSEYPVPTGWPDLSSQNSITPSSESVLRSFSIAIGNIETMDMAWDSNT